MGIEQLVSGIDERVHRAEQRFGRIADLWNQTVPPGIVRGSTLQSFSRGVLTVAVPNAAMKYRMEQLLREGLEARLRGGYAGTLRGVSVRIRAATQAEQTR